MIVHAAAKPDGLNESGGCSDAKKPARDGLLRPIMRRAPFELIAGKWLPEAISVGAVRQNQDVLLN